MNETASRTEIANRRLTLALRDGSVRELHPLWLRERCPCSECHDPKTGQRLLDAWSLPLETAVADAHSDGDRVEVTFSDGHVAPFGLAELKTALASRKQDERDDTVTGDATLDPIPEADWSVAKDDGAALYNMLEQLRRHAFVVVRNVPAEMDAVAEAVERIGPMRRTNWGGVADVTPSQRHMT